MSLNNQRGREKQKQKINNYSVALVLARKQATLIKPLVPSEIKGAV